MKPHVLIRKTIIKKNLKDVFDFFSKAENLARITPPALGFKIVSPVPIEMKTGAIIDYNIKILGLTFNWRSEITKWDPPFYFEDTQVKGPYKIWVHGHKFEEKENFTIMTDIVNYLSPGEIFEFIPHNLIVKRKVEEIFDFREKILESFFDF